MLSGQSCEDCTASLSIPDDGYISCNMTFRVIALKSLLGPEKRFIVQEKDFASCFDSRRNTLKSRFCSESRIKLPEKVTVPESVPMKAQTLPKSTPVKTTKTLSSDPIVVDTPLPPKKEFCEKAVEVNLDKVEPSNEVENDDKSVLSYYSAESIVMPKKVVEMNSSSNEDYYSIGQFSSMSRGSTLRANAERKIFDIEKCVLDMFEKHTTELNDIKAELRELKKVVSGISALHYGTLSCANIPSNTQLLCHIQELQHSVHVVENKLDSMTIDINARMKHQDRKLSEIRKELNTLISKTS